MYKSLIFAFTPLQIYVKIYLSRRKIYIIFVELHTKGLDMANIFDVSRYILDTIGGNISTMKLQKLCYYCQAWTLVWNNKQPLFAQNFQAWRDGPVCKELFDLHKGKFVISAKDIPSEILDNDLTEQQESFIRKVIEFYGKKSADWLSALTHQEQPWKEARERCGVKEGEFCDTVITLDSMYNYYSSL